MLTRKDLGLVSQYLESGKWTMDITGSAILAGLLQRVRLTLAEMPEEQPAEAPVEESAEAGPTPA